jgi:predicted transcriptional regulator
MKTKHVNYRRYEIIPNIVSNFTPDSSLGISKLNQLWQAIKRALFRSSEPQVWQEYVTQREPSGECSVQIWWHAYDPLTQRSVYCSSEEEMRAWLDQLPY